MDEKIYFHNIIINPSLLTQIGEQAVYIIKQRTLQGIFLEVSSPGSENYSTKPAPMPSGGLIERLEKIGAKNICKRLKKEGNIIFTNNQKTWVLPQVGYKRLRELAGKESNRVTLNLTGSMM